MDWEMLYCVGCGEKLNCYGRGCRAICTKCMKGVELNRIKFGPGPLDVGRKGDGQEKSNLHREIV